MQKATLSIFISTLFCLQILAQSCLPNGIQFQRQGQIDSFTLNYPGCTVIEGGIAFYGPTIVNLNGLSGLTAIGWNLQVGDAPNLTSLSGLENVTSIGALQIYGSGLTDLSGLQGLDSLQDLQIGFWGSFNPSLVSLNGMPNLSSIGSIQITQSSLVNLNGLEQITSAGGIDINGNSELVSLTGLNNLDFVDSHLLIRWNPKLMSLDGLENLRVVGGDFGIWANPLLTTLEGLEQLTSIGEVNEAEGMNIFNNALLSECAIAAVCDHLIQRPSTSHISNNAAGCDSVVEVESQCSTGANETLHKPISISPNPNNGTFTVQLPEPATPGAMFRITDLSGRLVQEQTTEPGSKQMGMQTVTLPAGMYFLQVISHGRLVAIDKFVKQ